MPLMQQPLMHQVVRSMSAARGPVRVLVVDDSLVIRHLVRAALHEAEGVEVVGEAANGALALEQIARLKPDVVTLDIEMPVLDGIGAMKRIRAEFPKTRVIMFSTLTTRGAAATFDALTAGADDYVAKAANAGSLDKSMSSLRDELVPKIRQFFGDPAARVPLPVAPAAPRGAAPAPGPGCVPGCVEIVGIGVSTGGPQALGDLMARLPAAFPVPVLIVQHMPATFTRLLAERLNSLSKLEVLEAEDGLEVRRGRVILARGGVHLKVRRDGAAVRAVFDEGPMENSCRPAVDVLFRSLADVYGPAVLPVVMTGMGYDGLKGVEALARHGVRALVQDEATSTVWGMPGAVARAGLAARQAPLAELAGIMAGYIERKGRW